MTILSVNKTRDSGSFLSFGFGETALSFLWMGAWRPFFVVGADCAHFVFFRRDSIMKKRSARFVVHAAVIAALYAVLTHMQNILLPGSASMAIQMRISEALCVLAFFTPAAIPGLTIGCLVFNLTFAGTLPLDFLVGTLATYLAAQGMWLTRNRTVKGYPLFGMLLPALTNAILVGWELAVYIGGGFLLNAVYVAIGEAVVLLVLGTALYYALKRRSLAEKLFS